VFAASSLGGAAREQYAAMEAGGGAVAAPPQKGAAQRPASRRPSRQKIGPDLLGTIFFFFSLFLFLTPSKGFLSQKRERAQPIRTQVFRPPGLEMRFRRSQGKREKYR
jgi:hypothetical protein